MCASGRPIMLLLFCLLGSATSSPVSTSTPAPPHSSQISPPSSSPTIHPSPPSPSLSIPPSILPQDNSKESTEKVSCLLTVSPSTLVVRFGDPVTANCSAQDMDFALLGWEVSQAPPKLTQERFLIWTVDRMTEWNVKSVCFAVFEHGGPCDIELPVIVYKPPDNVSISLINHTGPMFEGHQYTLQCTVQNFAPAENLIVTFYRGGTALAHLQPNNNTGEKPMTEIFTLKITPSKEDDGVQYWCEAKLQFGPAGPRHPPVMSQNFSAAVLFGPQLICPTKLQVREGERVSCEVRGNPKPTVTWYRDGQVVVLPTRSSRKHAGKYTVLALGHLEQKNFTVEIEVLPGSGTTNSLNGHFLLAVLLLQMINWL